MDASDRAFPPLGGDEVTTMRAFLAFHRETLPTATRCPPRQAVTTRKPLTSLLDMRG